MRLTQVMLFTGDVDRMRSFYADVIGMTVIDAEPGFVRLGDDGCVIALHAIRGGGPSEPEDRSDYPTKLCFHADDVPAARAALIAKGARFGEARAFGDLVICDGADPDGNVLQLTNR